MVLQHGLALLVLHPLEWNLLFLEQRREGLEQIVRRIEHDANRLQRGRRMAGPLLVRSQDGLVYALLAVVEDSSADQGEEKMLTLVLDGREERGLVVGVEDELALGPRALGLPVHPARRALPDVHRRTEDLIHHLLKIA